MRTIIDDRGRLFGWANLVDLLVVVLLVGLVALAFVRFVKPEGRQIPIRSTFTVQRVKDVTAVQFVKGKDVRDDAGNLLGTIDRVTERKSLEEVPTAQGDLKPVESPIFIDVIVEVLGEGRKTSSDYELGNIAIRIGKLMTLIGPGFEVKATVTGVTAAK